MWQPRSLVLDATTSAVRAQSNIHQKAERLLDRHKSAIAIVVDGGKIVWRTKQPRPGHPDDAKYHIVTEQVERAGQQSPAVRAGVKQ